jgi:hypothetical protein
MVSLVSFWSGEQPVAVLSYYATHPQSYYRTGIPNPDFPGLARFLRQLAVPAALHIHFNGAGGNIGAGKYNDGAPENRRILAERLADGMRRAWESTKRELIGASDVSWATDSVALKPTQQITIDQLEAQLKEKAKPFLTGEGASRLAWLRRCEAGHSIDLTCLKLGRARVLHLPGEPFVEYQLAAKAERRDLFVAVAGYGDYAPWYIGTAAAYEQGGYETSPSASNVGPELKQYSRRQFANCSEDDRKPHARDGLRSESGKRGPGRRTGHKLKREQSAGEIHELLKRAIELFGQPLAETKLHEHQEAPGQHRRKKFRQFAFQKFTAHRCQHSKRERQKFRRRQQPEGRVQSWETGEKRFAEFAIEPRRDSIRQLADRPKPQTLRNRRLIASNAPVRTIRDKCEFMRRDFAHGSGCASTTMPLASLWEGES